MVARKDKSELKVKPDRYEVLIEAGLSERNYWKDLWRFRELFYILSWRDIKVRYKQTTLGAAWAILRPLLAMIIFSVVFGRIANLSSIGNTPYSILVFTGLLPWQFFANSLSEASNSLIGNANLITKVYFPRIIIPVSSIVTSLVDFFISLILLSALILIYQIVPPGRILFLPVFLLIALITSTGISLLITALNVKYRDFRYIVPFIVQFGLYISPVGFTSSVVPKKWQLLYAINPMVGVIDGFRWCIIEEAQLNISSQIISIGTSFILLIIGIWYFRSTEKYFADTI